MGQEQTKMPKVLVINPNSTKSMTDGLEKLIQDHEEKKNLTFAYLTSPSGPASINNEDDATESLEHVKKALTPAILEAPDAFVVACYSDHPLVGWLEEQPQILKRKKPVYGIFQASITKSLQVLGGRKLYGIVSTGKVWEKALSEGVSRTGNPEAIKQFVGVQTTGLNATELHDAPPDLVRRKMTEATKRLVRGGGVGAVCLGCAGMAGMDEMVRAACKEELGEAGEEIQIIDGVLAAVDLLAAHFGTS